jgi:hypothetical protein
MPNAVWAADTGLPMPPPSLPTPDCRPSADQGARPSPVSQRPLLSFTRELMLECGDWLGWERHRLYANLFESQHGSMQECTLAFLSNAFDWHEGPRPARFNGPGPETHAAPVLSPVGRDWRREQR